MAYAKQQRKKGTLTKDEIVQCAFNLIANKGTEGCSMRALGNELGVSAMALYGYIPSRESLLNEVIERFLKTVDTRTLGRHAHSHNSLAASSLRFFPAFRRAHVRPVRWARHRTIHARAAPYLSWPRNARRYRRAAHRHHRLVPYGLRIARTPKLAHRASRSGAQAGRGRCSALCDDIARPRHAHRQSEPRRRTTALQRALAPNRRRRLFRDLVPKGPTRNYRRYSRRHGRTTRELANAAITC